MRLFPDFQTGILLAKRARYLSTSFWFIVVTVGVALLAAQFSGRQPATVALDVGFSTIRLLLPVLIILLIQELLYREFDRRYYLISFTYPRSRHWFLLGRLAVVLLLVTITLVTMSVALIGVTDFIASGYTQATPANLGINFWLTVVFIAVDLFVLTTIAGLIAITASTPSFVLIGTLGFMFIARSYSSIIALLGQNQYVLKDTETYQHSLAILHYILPDLAALDIRVISLYGQLELIPDDWSVNLISSLAYGIALTAISLLLLQRKRFS